MACVCSRATCPMGPRQRISIRPSAAAAASAAAGGVPGGLRGLAAPPAGLVRRKRNAVEPPSGIRGRSLK